MATTMEKLLNDYRLTTAEILYHLPDHPSLLQSYIWQEYDKTPDFPELKQFLDFWEKKIEGRLHSVTVASVELIKPSDMRIANGELSIH